jgi:hypothetical protein
VAGYENGIADKQHKSYLAEVFLLVEAFLLLLLVLAAMAYPGSRIFKLLA